MPTTARPLLLALLAVPALASPGLHAQDPLTQKALQRIAEVEGQEPALEAGDGQRANLLLNQLAWAGKRLNAVSDQTEAHWLDAKRRYDALWQKIEAKGKAGTPAPAGGGYDHAKLVQLDKEVRNGYGNFAMLQVKHLADDFRQKSLRKELADLEQRLAAFPADDANVKVVAGNLKIFRDRVEAALAQLKGDQAAAGSVVEQLAKLGAKYESDNRPDVLVPPFDAGQVTAWCLEMRGWREVELPKDLAWLQETARPNAAVDQNRVTSLLHWLGGTWPDRLDEIEKAVRERICSDVDTGLGYAKFVLETRADDRDQVVNRILGRGRFDEQMARLRDGLHAVSIARVYDREMGAPAVMGPTRRQPLPEGEAAPEAPDRDAQQATLERAIEHLKRCAVVALDNVRLPEAASNDPELLKIAAATLAREDYEIAGWEKLVINAPLTRKVRREAWLKPGSASRTVRLDYYEYVWDQYQVTTVERVGDQLWLFANTLKLYQSGDPTTPVGRWILSRRLELTPIPAKNLGD